MDRNLIEKARELINANYISTTPSTVDREYNVNIAITVLEMIDDDTIICPVLVPTRLTLIWKPVKGIPGIINQG